ATLDAAGLTLDAERSGFSFALTAGVAVGTGVESSNLAVAVAVNTITSGSEAFLHDVHASLVGDTRIGARNDDQIWAIDGAATLGGKSGKGAAVSVNVINDHAHAYAADSVLSQTAGALPV